MNFRGFTLALGLLLLPLIATCGCARRPARGNNCGALVGSYRHSHAYSSGGSSALHEEHLVLAADGTCQFSTSAASGPVGADDRARFQLRGKWSASKKVLTLDWAGGPTEKVPFTLASARSIPRLAFHGKGGSKWWERVP